MKKLLSFLKSVRFLGLLIIPLFAISCGGKQATTPSTSSGQVLTIWRAFDDEEVFENAIRQFQTTHKNLKIRYLKKDFSDYELESLNALATGEGPDIWSIPNDWIVRHKDKLVAAPEGLFAIKEAKAKKSDTEVYQNTFAPLAASQNIIDNKIYGVPLGLDTLSIFYNPQLFQDALKRYEDAHRKDISSEAQAEKAKVRKLLQAPPATWDDFIEAVKLLTVRSGETIEKSAVAMGTASNIPNSEDILSLLMLQNGTKMTSDEGKNATFNLPQTKTTGEKTNPGLLALDFYGAFANPKKEVYTWNNGLGDARQAFIDEKVAMIFDYPFFQNQIKDVKPTLRFQTAAAPQIRETPTPIAYGEYFTETVTKNSKNPKLAWEFLAFLSKKENLSAYSRATKKPSPLADVPGTDAFAKQVKIASSWTKGREPAKVDEAIRKMIDEVVSGTASQTALDKAASAITTLLQTPSPMDSSQPKA